MAKPVRDNFLRNLSSRYGVCRKLPKSNSLYEVGDGAARVYIRYSKRHERNTTFYGLRNDDLKQLQSHASFIVFLWDDQADPVLVPFSEYEGVFGDVGPAPDGQFKAIVDMSGDCLELYIARAGRFNLEGLSGWEQLDRVVGASGATPVPELSHSDVQSILADIGVAKGFDIWVPANDRGKLSESRSRNEHFRPELPTAFAPVVDILQEVDVVWLQRGSSDVSGLFEVEHTTPIYSALLRFNDVYLFAKQSVQNFRVIADDSRRPQFVRQLNRPTFQASGLNRMCTFLEYRNVYGWYRRICPFTTSGGR